MNKHTQIKNWRWWRGKAWW